MKRTCEGCKAMEQPGYQRRFCCGLGYPVQNNYVVKTGSLLASSPLEECEKPLSTKKYVELLHSKIKHENIRTS